jgi:hypothetical protein
MFLISEQRLSMKKNGWGDVSIFLCVMDMIWEGLLNRPGLVIPDIVPFSPL